MRWFLDDEHDWVVPERSTHMVSYNFYTTFGARGFQNFNGTPGVEFFISLGFAEPTNHVIQAYFYIW